MRAIEVKITVDNIPTKDCDGNPALEKGSSYPALEYKINGNKVAMVMYCKTGLIHYLDNDQYEVFGEYQLKLSDTEDKEIHPIFTPPLKPIAMNPILSIKDILGQELKTIEFK